jgi:hypothetical protein
MPRVGFVGSHGAEAIFAADDGNRGGDERSLGEGDGEVDAPGMDGDVLSEQAGAGVLLDAEGTEEGEERRAPIARISKDGEVEPSADGAQVLQREPSGRGGEVGVTVPVEEACPDPVEDATAR